MGGGKLHTPAPQSSEGRGQSPRGAEGWIRGTGRQGGDLARGRKPQRWIRGEGSSRCLPGPFAAGTPSLQRRRSLWLLRSCCPEGGQGPGSRVLAAPTWPALSPGGAPAGRGGCARAAALHQLGGLWHLLREPGPGPGSLPHEPEWLPKLLGRADRCVRPSSPTLTATSRRGFPPGVVGGSRGTRRRGSVPQAVCGAACESSPPCRPAGARSGPRGVQGLPKQWAAGGTTGQRTPHLCHPSRFLHRQVRPPTAWLALPPEPWAPPDVSPGSPQELWPVRVHAGGGGRARREAVRPAAPGPRLVRREICFPPAPALRLCPQPPVLEINTAQNSGVVYWARASAQLLGCRDPSRPALVSSGLIQG